jgi:hypothetical protein
MVCGVELEFVKVKAGMVAAPEFEVIPVILLGREVTVHAMLALFVGEVIVTELLALCEQIVWLDKEKFTVGVGLTVMEKLWVFPEQETPLSEKTGVTEI